MKKISKITFAVVTLVIMVSSMFGCTLFTAGKYKFVELNGDLSEEFYLELKADNKYDWVASTGTTSGTWELDGEKLKLKPELGGSIDGTLKDNTIEFKVIISFKFKK